MQYTIRGIPPSVDAALRARAKATGKSLNEAAVEALTEGAGVSLVGRGFLGHRSARREGDSPGV